MAPTKEPHLTPTELAELSALADGSLEPDRRKAVETWIASSPQLRQLYERERAVVEVLRQSASERAPIHLRTSIEALRSGSRRARRRVAYPLVAGALAAVALAVTLALPAGTPGSPSISQAALLALRGSSSGAPSPDPTAPATKLVARLQEVYFPNWSATLGWRAIGLRQDRLGQQPATTVYYRRRDRRVAYTIVGAPALPQPSGRITRLNGFELRVLTIADRTVVTWRRAGHTCVLSATGVPAKALEQLAAWRSPELNS